MFIDRKDKIMKATHSVSISRRVKALTRVGVALCAVTGALAAAPATAQADPGKHFERECVIVAAPGSDGVKGNGCNLYGPVKVVSYGPPPDLSAWAESCLRSGLTAVIGATYAREPRVIVAAAALGCAAGIADAAIFGS
ncbi:hypothetical protein ACWEKT_38235 [Nocardia takedensis]|uniref:hypothetical protein n=1 Tax=Nocardia takedensis TaxID=259390 RepID=UPI00030C0AED|nr:hypothetical protein [Nocardia takedensis]